MGEYGQVLWLPIAAGLTVIGIIVSVVRWRRRGAGSGLRGFAWALLPMGLYLIGLLGLLVPFAFKIVGWAAHLVFSLTAWLGIAVLALAVVLWVVSGVIIGRRQASGSDSKDRSVGSGTGGRSVTAGRTPATSTGTSGTSGSTAPLPATRSSAPAAKDDDDDMQDIEEILKRRGIS